MIGKSFEGWTLNPTTNDRLHYGQIRTYSIFAHYLYYYPSFAGGPLTATIKVNVPKRWTFASAGTLVEQKGNQFVYEYNFRSDKMPYVLAIYWYSKVEFKNGKLPITIFFDEDDPRFVAEKKEFILNEILPFGGEPHGRVSTNIGDLISELPVFGITSQGHISLVWVDERICRVIRI